MTPRRLTNLGLGIVLWGGSAWLLGDAGWRVRARIAQPRAGLTVQSSTPHLLQPGDAVFAETSDGLRVVGEVVATPDDTTATCALRPAALHGVGAEPTAVCWRTPLSVEDALVALFPADVQERIAARVTADWHAHEAQIMAAWRPIATRLTAEFLELIGPHIEEALRARESQLRDIGAQALDDIGQRWPGIQERLDPILQRHLTPVVSRLLDDALAQAPKGRLAWYISINRNDRAFQLILDWLSAYLAAISEDDKAELATALGETWDAAAHDDVLSDRLRQLANDLQSNTELRALLTGIYRDAIGQNPETSEFLRISILESPAIQQEVYRFIEVFAPTARHIAQIFLFDDLTGEIRPEVAHLVRSIALDRRVAWITLTATAGGSLAEGAHLAAEVRGGWQ